MNSSLPYDEIDPDGDLAWLGDRLRAILHPGPDPDAEWAALMDADAAENDLDLLGPPSSQRHSLTAFPASDLPSDLRAKGQDIPVAPPPRPAPPSPAVATTGSTTAPRPRRRRAFALGAGAMLAATLALVGVRAHFNAPRTGQPGAEGLASCASFPDPSLSTPGGTLEQKQRMETELAQAGKNPLAALATLQADRDPTPFAEEREALTLHVGLCVSKNRNEALREKAKRFLIDLPRSRWAPTVRADLERDF